MERTITFHMDGSHISIQSNENEKMDDVISKLSSKKHIDLSSSMFLYKGEQLKRNLTFDDIANKVDLARSEMNIVVNTIENNSDDEKEITTKSKMIICPQCKELCKINIYDYKIALYACKNNHKTSNIFFKDFDNSQMIDENKIKCGECQKNNKRDTYNNEFYICKICNQNICPICKKNHYKNHNNIINYDLNPFLCNEHNRAFNSFCNDCKKDICIFCEKEHQYHYTISYGSLFLSQNDLKNNLNELKYNFGQIKNNEIKNDAEVIQNFESYYKISEYIINNYDDKNINFFVLNNINVISQKNKEYSNELKKINNETDISKKTKLFSDIYTKIQNIDKESDENHDKMYPEEQSFLYELKGNQEYNKNVPHHWYIPHGPHQWFGPHYPPEWHGLHGPHNWYGTHFPPNWNGNHGPHDWPGFHGPHERHRHHFPHDSNLSHGPHRPHVPHDWDRPHGSHGPHEWDGPHGPHGSHDWNKPYGSHSPHESDGPHGPHGLPDPNNFQGIHGPHYWYGPHFWHRHHGPHGPHDWNDYPYGDNDPNSGKDNNM